MGDRIGSCGKAGLAVVTGDEFDDYSYPLHMMGAASTLPVEQVDDVVRRLHEVVEEVTGKPVEPPKRNGMGFIW